MFFSRQHSIIIVAVLFFFFASEKLFSLPFQNPSQWVRFSTDEGLPSNRVIDVADAPNGMVWALTSAGLAYYNGYFWTPVGESIGMNKIQIQSFCIDSSGRVTAISHGKLFVGNDSGFSMKELVLNNVRVRVRELAQYTGGNFLIVLENLSLHLYDKDFSYLSPFTLLPSTEKIYRIWNTRCGNIWIATQQSIYCLKNGVMVKMLGPVADPITVTNVSEDKLLGGIMSIAYPTELRGLWEWKPDEPPQRTREGAIDFIQTLDIADNAHPIYSYLLGEIRLRFNNTWGSVSAIPEHVSNIQFLKYRTSGDVWFGTENGLFLYKSSPPLLTYWKDEKVSRANKITDFLIAKDGSIWISSDDGLEIRKQNNTVEVITQAEDRRLYAITGLAQDKEGNIWISSGAAFEGAYRWDGKRWKYFGKNDGLFGFIHKIRKDRSNNLWFLGLARFYSDEANEPGAFILKEGTFQRWTTKNGLLNNRVYAFAEGNDGARWFGTNGGVCRWKEGAWKYWALNEGLMNKRIFTIAIDSENTAWFSDQVSGVGRIQNDQISYLTTLDGLVSNTVWDIHVDSVNRVWISTASGLSCYDNGNWFRFDANIGLSPLQLWPVLTHNKKLYIGTKGGGTAIVNLDLTTKEPPRVVIEQPAHVDNSLLIRWNAHSFWGELPSRVIETRYRLDNGEWSEWNTVRHTLFSGLRSGEHVFIVQAKSLFGKFLGEGFSYSFTIEKPYYLQPIYYIPVLSLAIGMFITAFVYFSRKRKQDALLRLSEERYRNVIRDQTDLIIRFTPEGKLLFANDAYCQFVKLTYEQIVGKTFKEITPPSILKQINKHIQTLKHLIPEHPTTSWELEVILPTGEIRWLSWIDRAIFDEQKNLIEVQAVGRDITRQKIAELALRRRESILETLSFATEHFMQSESLKKNMSDILSKLGEATEVSRVYIFENQSKEDGTISTSQRFEWTAENIKPEIDNPDLQNIPLEEAGFGRWIDLLSKDSYVYGNVKDFPESERFLLEPQNILSICVVPIFVNRQWWGFIGFDDCETLRQWSFAELEALKSVANLFGSAIERQEREKTVQMLASAIKSISECVSITDNDNTILFVNDAFLNTYGYESSELIGQHIGIVRSEQTTPPTSLIEATTKEHGWQGELLNRKKDGTVFPIYLSTSLVRDDSGKPIAMIGVALDITQQKLVEKRLQEQAALLDITTDAIIVVDLQYVVAYWNKGAEQMYGWDSKKIRGNDMRPHIYREHQTETAAITLEVLRRGEWQGELHQYTKDGKALTVYCRIVLMKDDEQRPSSLLFVNTNITEKKQMESQILRMQRLESIGTMAGGIAHDLNNVLAPILLSVELLRQQFPAEQTRKILTTLETSATRGKDIIKQVLTFARGMTGERITLQPRHFIKEMEQMIRETFPKSLHLVVDIPSDLWTITGDTTQIHQVLLNLCVNAKDAMPQGGTLTLTASNIMIDEQFVRTHYEAQPGPYVALRVSDTGTGIAPELLDKIFDPFFTTKEIGKGTGLGLSTVHAIVKGHQGFVTITSKVSAGSTFSVFIPASSGEAVLKPVTPEPEIHRGNGELIMVVDDESAILEIALQTLEASGYQVITARDGTEAIALYVQQMKEIKIVVTDILMPFMDGIALSRSLKQLNHDVKIIAASGQEADAQFLTAEGISVEGFLPKPFSSDQLVATINRVLLKQKTVNK